MTANNNKRWVNKEVTIEHLQAVLEASFDGILVTDGTGQVLMVNEAYERLTGILAEEMIGNNMKELLNPYYMKQSAALMVLEEKGPVTIPHQTRNGRDIMVTSTPIFDEKGEIYLVVTNVRDITEIYELRQELVKAHEMEKVYYRHLEKKIKTGENEIIAVSKDTKEMLSLAKKVSAVDVTVLITGESGVGKEVVARYIHQNSSRKDRPFITVNCGAIPEQLLESELFGYVGGAFTGALKNGREGLFGAAQGGTLFLDEIGELPLNLQVKILRALENREITKIGANEPTPIDVRIVTATNRDLTAMVKDNTFRKDLFYRLDVVQLKIPPLRERIEDIASLSLYYLYYFNSKYHQKKKLNYDVIKAMESYSWPGNVRELKNVVERMVVVSRGEFFQVKDLPWLVRSSNDEAGGTLNVEGIMPLPDAVEELEKQLITNAMQHFRTSREIAKAIHINQSTVVRKIQKYGLKMNNSH